MGPGVAHEFVGAAPKVLHERVTADNHACGLVAFSCALVPAVRFVVSRCRGALGRAWVRSITSPCTDGCSASRRSSRRRRGRAGTRVGDRWFVDETYVKVAGRWRYVYRAIDQHGQIIDVYVSARHDTRAARRFFATALGAHGEPTEVVTDRAWTLLAVVDELMPAVLHNTEQYANNKIESDHGRLKSRLRPKRTARTMISGGNRNPANAELGTAGTGRA